MKRILYCLLVFAALSAIGPMTKGVLAADPTGSVTSVTLTLDPSSTVTNVSMRLVPGERRIVRVKLTKTWTQTLNLGQYTTYTLMFKNDAGVNVSSQTMTKESPVASGIVGVNLTANKVTKDCKKGAVLCQVAATSGTVHVIAGWFTVSTPSVNLP